MADLASRSSANAPAGGQMDLCRTSGRCAKPARTAGPSHIAWVTRILVMAMGAVAVATAQTSDPRIVFTDTTRSPAVLFGDLTSDLGASFCTVPTCKTEEGETRTLEDEFESGCFCDNDCGVFGDCCHDSPRVADKPRADLTCVPLKQYDGVYLVSRCPAEWSDDKTRRLCERDSPINPSADVFVSNRRTGITYRNRACAACHSDTDRDEVVPWQKKLVCPGADKKKPATPNQSDTGQWSVVQTIDGVEKNHACLIDLHKPETLKGIVRRCEPVVDSCPASWTDKRVLDLCGAYYGRVYGSRISTGSETNEHLSFRNQHCALCHGMVADQITCAMTIEVRMAKQGVGFSGNSFSIVLDISEETGSNTIGVKTVCEGGEIWDEHFVKCRSVSCLEGFRLEGDECVPASPSKSSKDPGEGAIIFEDPDVFRAPGRDAIIFEDDNRSKMQETGRSNVPKADDDLDTIKVTDFQRCPKIFLSADEFVDRGDGVVVVEQYQRNYGPGEFAIREGELAICAIDSDFSKFDNTLSVMSVVFLAGSMFCLCCHLVLFCLVPDLRNLSGKNLASLCVSLLVGYTCFVASPFEATGTAGCRTLGIIMYTAFIASFFWMNVMAFDVFITLRQATVELRVPSGHQKRRYLLYLLYVCVMTAAFVVAAVATDSNGAEEDPYRPAFGERVCWFSRRRSLMVFFAAPLIVIMVANVAFFVGSTSIIRKTTQSTASMTCGPTKTNLRLYSRLAVVTGLSWLVGLLAGWLDFKPLWYAFVILNTLQGVFIFVFFTLADRVRERVQRDIARYSRWQASEGKLSDVPGSDTGLRCGDSAALQLTDSRP